MHGHKSNTGSTFPPTTSPPLKGQIRDTPLFVVWTCHFCLYLYYYASATAKTNYHPFIKTTCITTLSKVLDSTFVKFHRTHIMNTLLQCLDCKKTTSYFAKGPRNPSAYLLGAWDKWTRKTSGRTRNSYLKNAMLVAEIVLRSGILQSDMLKCHQNSLKIGVMKSFRHYQEQSVTNQLRNKKQKHNVWKQRLSNI